MRGGLQKSTSQKRRLRAESLESRLLFHAGHHHEPVDVAVYESSDGDLSQNPSIVAADPNAELAAGDSSSSTVAAAALHPLSAIPVLNSLPGAAQQLFLDFDGHYESSWGSYSDINTPAFDQDFDASTFSDGELTTIGRIWEYVTEDFAPFKINVTTVQPSSFANGVALRVAIGGNGSWTGGTYGGIAYINSFTNLFQNTVYVFPKNLGNGNAKYTAEASSHESGHSFGLQHQSQYSTSGTLLNAYYAGPGDGRAPIMGNSYYATRGLWWNGTSTSSTTIQDDMAVISRSANKFGYRTDDHGNTDSAATVLALDNNAFASSGIIATTADLDYFSFSAPESTVTVSVAVPASINNLDSRLELRDATGTLLVSAAPSDSFGATITTALAAGSYFAVVASNGQYGDVGQYTLSGTIVPTTPPVTPVLGDMNDDGLLDNEDIDPFVLALTDSAAYAQLYPQIDYLARGDMNADGLFDNEDIQGFVDGLAGAGAPPSAPASEPQTAGQEPEVAGSLPSFGQAIEARAADGIFDGYGAAWIKPQATAASPAALPRGAVRLEQAEKPAARLTSQPVPIAASVWRQLGRNVRSAAPRVDAADGSPGADIALAID